MRQALGFLFYDIRGHIDCRFVLDPVLDQNFPLAKELFLKVKDLLPKFYDLLGCGVPINRRFILDITGS